MEAIMVTPDKDYAQLVGPKRAIWRPAKKGSSGFEKLGVAEVVKNGAYNASIRSRCAGVDG